MKDASASGDDITAANEQILRVAPRRTGPCDYDAAVVAGIAADVAGGAGDLAAAADRQLASALESYREGVAVFPRRAGPRDRGVAHQAADAAVSKLYHKGLFRGHPAKPYYEAMDGVGHLMYALLQLELVLQDPQEVLAKQAIAVGKNGQLMAFDNW